MNAVPFPLLPVGVDCDCGFPLVWYGDERRCAVYGSHPAAGQILHFKSAPTTAVARLLHDLNTVPCPASRSVARRDRRARDRALREAV